MDSTHKNSDDNKLPVPGTVYSIPEGTHADLDIQDDKEDAFSRRSPSWRRRSQRDD